ncbi:TetR/AcrR family transcriptional regulator [Dermatobacter hominis]|uniref:TetR/AcrR family transcriptional regulator n=1 Tax=Dermatobacter hominis TaxID=2884263 RepID=UPI001D117462|nr:TetR/AcrR family transcriptional regulator [Dermatobacter hominis]UDY35884.1 TetR/AcrR family transcriptional regulator [Dermatobacter hominis]
MNPRRTSQRRATSEDHETRDRLLEATCRIVAEEGVGGATSRRITSEAGANLAAITYHFGSKQSLVRAALAAEVERLVEPALSLLEGDDDPAARLLGATQQLLATFEQERDRSPAYLVALVEAVREPGDDGPATVVVRLRDRVATVIAELIADGTVARWVDPRSMASLIVAAANGIALQSSLDPDGPSPTEQTLQFVQLLLSARTAA